MTESPDPNKDADATETVDSLLVDIARSVEAIAARLPRQQLKQESTWLRARAELLAGLQRVVEDEQGYRPPE